MNITHSFPKPTISADAAQLLAILRDCGIDSVWQNPGAQLLSSYLRNTPDSDADIKAEIGRKRYLEQITSSTSLPRETQTSLILRWLLTNADGCLLNQALRVSAQEDLKTLPKAIIYDEHSQIFAQDDADFSKLVMLLILECFPNPLWYGQETQFECLTYYQYFRAQYGNSKTLQSFRKSIVKQESGTFAKFAKISKARGKVARPKTACARKYFDMPSYDRLRLMRYYKFISENQ